MAAEVLVTNGSARAQEQQASETPHMTTTDTKEIYPVDDTMTKRTDSTYGPVIDSENSLGVQFLKNLASDQKAIWASPIHLRWADGTWLFPLAAVTGGFFATDRAVPPALSTDPNKLNQYTNLSNYELYSMIGAGGGLYLWSKLSHDDHQRETGILAGEALPSSASEFRVVVCAIDFTADQPADGASHKHV